MSKLQKMINDFLEERRISEYGGWAPVTKEDMNALRDILVELIELKWSADPDGDRPMNFVLVDRTRYGSFHFHPVPYEHKCKTDEEALLAIELHHLNLRIASEGLDRAMRLWKVRREEAKEKKD